jgi:hypothetical protein
MSGEINHDRRRFFGTAATMLAAAQFALSRSADAQPHPDDPGSYARKFSGRYAHRTIKGGIGHNLPHEAPRAFAEAIIDVADS